MTIHFHCKKCSHNVINNAIFHCHATRNTTRVFIIANSNLTGIVSANHNNVIQHNGLKVSSLYYVGYKNSPGGVDFEVELHQTYSYGIAIAMPCWEVLSEEEFSISFNGLSGSKAKFKAKGTKSPQICVIAVGK